MSKPDAHPWTEGLPMAVEARGRLRRMDTIDRLTPTQVLVGAARYRRDTGRQIGGGRFDARSIRPASDAEVERWDLLQCLARSCNDVGSELRSGGILRVDSDHVPTETIRTAVDAMAALLKACE